MSNSSKLETLADASMNDNTMNTEQIAESRRSVGSLPITYIRSTSGWAGFGLSELRKYKGLLYFLAWRDIKVRYKQTALGAAWAVLQPFFMMLLFTLLFNRIARISTSVPYPVFAYAGLLPWQLFAFGLNESSNSLVSNQRLITKIYFPRLVIPLSAIAAGTVDFGIAFTLLLGMMVYYGVAPGWPMLLLPAFVLLTMLTSLAVGLWLSALNVKYRDVRYTLGFMVQFWMLATPIGYPLSMVPEKWKLLYSLNPMVGVVEGFRWAIVGVGNPPGITLLVSAVIMLVLLLGGADYFRRMERTFADIV